MSVTTTKIPDFDLVTEVITGNAGLTVGTNLFIGPVRPADTAQGVPAECVFVLATGGAEPEDFCNGNLHTPQRYTFFVQIRVRSEPNNYSGGQTTALAVRDLVLDSPPADYYETRFTEAYPIYLGRDQQGSHEWSMNVRMSVKE